MYVFEVKLVYQNVPLAKSACKVYEVEALVQDSISRVDAEMLDIRMWSEEQDGPHER